MSDHLIVKTLFMFLTEICIKNEVNDWALYLRGAWHGIDT